MFSGLKKSLKGILSLDTSASEITQQQKAISEDEFPFGTSSTNWSSGRYVKDEDALTLSAVWAAIKIISEDVSKLPLRLYKSRPDGGREQVTEHPLARLLRNPNRWQTLVDLLKQQVVSLVMQGNSVSVILRDAQGRPNQLINVQYNRVEILISEDGDLFYRISRFTDSDKRQLKDADFIVPATDILHHKGMSIDGISGMSPLSAARVAIEYGLQLEGHGNKLFTNGAQPGGILTYPGKLKSAEAKAIVDSWNREYGGGNSGRIAVLPDGLDWKAMAITNTDAEFLLSRKFQIDEIARFYRIPPHMLAQMDKSSFSNIEHQSKEYVDSCLMPYLETIEANFNKTFNLHLNNMYVEFDVSRLLRADAKTRYETYAAARQWGLNNANEIRAKEGENPYPGGEMYWAPVNMVNAEKLPDVANNPAASNQVSDPADSDDPPIDEKTVMAAFAKAHKGLWQADKSYVAGNVVVKDGGTWIAQDPVPGEAPGESSGWAVIALRGSRGKTGRSGTGGGM